MRYFFMAGAVDPASKCHGQANEINACSSIKEPVGGIHDEAESSVGDTKFVSGFGRKCNIGQFCWKFERF